jgi:hypothetical protein
MILKTEQTINNLKKFEFPEHDVDLLVEIQSLPIRINKHGTNQQIGVCFINGAGIGQGSVKLLYLDSENRKTHLKGVHKALMYVGLCFGFNERIYQRKKPDGNFLSFIKKIIVKYKND